uniref:Calmodulin-lysine N-methyltransferase n=1 Tax=Ditylum brightwellii TaxID=49249 RepID=A0A7S1ZLV6_9STRA|mmetsp:Transcript_3466/g.5356  ORF Transcript_3466/g.5356 Transcript_3466/m.5356 type:complete len:368 (+) Transcript_3466:179-1282(+)
MGNNKKKHNNKIKASGGKPSSSNNKASASSKDDAASTNRPKNHLIMDATSPYTFTYTQYGSKKSITVNQTPNEDTWPGGALWDIGVLMAKLLVSINCPTYSVSIPRLIAPGIWGPPTTWKDKRILELGCGVGLTGLVAASLGARCVLLTDLEVVVNKVTLPNVELVVGSGSGGISSASGSGGGAGGKKKGAKGINVAALPLCWGNEDDENAAKKVLDEMAPPQKLDSLVSAKKKGGKKKVQQQQQHPSSPNDQQKQENNSIAASSLREGIPDILLIGDVAYQHKPGAPSHFDVLLSTILNITDEHTVVMFGTRMRMAASNDLLDMFYLHFEEIVTPPIEAHEVDDLFSSEALGRKHNITIHIFRRKK